MTLPTPLPYVDFPPEPDRIPVIQRRARRRRRSQAAGALGLASVTMAGAAVFGGAGGATGLRGVDPVATPPAGSASAAPPADRGGASSPAPSPSAEGGQRPDRTPPADPGAPDPGRGGGTPPPPGWGGPWPTETVVRETVADDGRACSDTVTTVFHDHPEKSATTCLRYSWPTAMPYAKGGTFLVELCATTRDVTAEVNERPGLRIGPAGQVGSWYLPPGETREETLSVGTCWRWTVTWTGYQLRSFREQPVEPFAAGTYEVTVGTPFAATDAVRHEDGRQTTVEIV